MDDETYDIELRMFLKTLSDDLERRHLKEMTFLLADHLPRAELEQIRSGCELFDLLMDKGPLSLQFLAELLHLIGRNDLIAAVKRFASNSSALSLTQIEGSDPVRLTDLRRLMYRVAQDIDKNMVDEIKYIEKLSRHENIQDGIDLMDYFVKNRAIESLEDLENEFKIHADLQRLCRNHKERRVQCRGRAPENCSYTVYPYQRRWSSLFPCEDAPTFPSEYSHSAELTVCENPDLFKGNLFCEGTYKKRPVIVKSLKNSDVIRMKDLKMTVYLRHPFLLSIIKAELSEKQVRFVYGINLNPKTDKLVNFLKNGAKNELPPQDEQRKRIKILFQISDALRFLHTPLKHMRGSVVHMDVNPHNILVDAFGNAFLAHIDAAVEIPDDATHLSIDGVKTSGYSDWYEADQSSDRRKRPSDDIFGLGIIALQVLKWQLASEDNNKWKLFESVRDLVHTQLETDIKDVEMDQINRVVLTTDFINEDIWSGERGFQTKIGHIALNCLLHPKHRIKAHRCSEMFKEILVNNRWKLLEYEKNDQRCIQCHFYDKSNMLKITSDSCKKDCGFYNKFCRKCHYYSFRNPLHCPNHGTVYPMIGSPRNFVILITGYDGDRSQYLAFQKDVDYMKRVVTDPRIMNTRLENILEVRKGDITNEVDFEKQVETQITGEVDCLFVYYSGHQISEEKIRVTKNSDEFIKISKFREILGRIQFEGLLMLFDCCFAASVDPGPSPVPLSCKWMAILYSSGPENSAICNTEKGSLFTRYFLTGLQSSQKCVCEEKNQENCIALKQFRDKASSTGFIELRNLTKYLAHVSNKFKSEVKFLEKGPLSDQPDIVIAYYNKDVIVYNFRFIDQKIEIPIQLEQIDHSASTLEAAVLCKLRREIAQYAPPEVKAHLKCPSSKLQLKREIGEEEITEVTSFKKWATRNECFKVYLECTDTSCQHLLYLRHPGMHLGGAGCKDPGCVLQTFS